MDQTPKATNVQYANDLNNSYNRFDELDFSADLRKLHTSLSNQDYNIAVSECEVGEHIEELGLSNGAVPDCLASKTLQYCATELSRIFTYILNLSLK